MQKRRLIGWLAGALTVAVAAAGAPYAKEYVSPTPATFEAAVRVTVGNSAGSGVALDGGLVLTAAHVVKGAKVVSLKAADGRIGGAEVLWVNEARDSAMLRTNMKLPAAKLDCRPPQVGDDIFTIGNPVGVEFVAAYGKIAGKAREFGPVKNVFVTNISSVYGQSGGGVFNADGLVVGINSMTMLAPIPTGPNSWSPTMTGYGFIVPASEICLLLGRSE